MIVSKALPNKMNAFKSFSLPLVGLVLCLGLVVAGDVTSDLEKLAEQEGDELLFDEDQDGYDKHADIFYYQDDTVNKEYERKRYMAAKVTLAGQKPDSTLRVVKSAVNPFGVGQRTFKQFGTLMDRWDVKDTGKEAQYLALYHGNGKAYVVNKVRAHLLRTLANAVNDYLPSLDRLAEPDASNDEKTVHEVTDDIRGTIERVFREVDNTVRKTMADSDDSIATATVAIVSKAYIITVNVGKGKVIAYDNNYETTDLTPNEDDAELRNVFGAKRSRTMPIHPHVEFFSREENGYQFLLMETPAVAEVVYDEAATSVVTSEIDQHKYVESEEQEIYSQSIVRILNQVENQQHPLKRFFVHSDYSIILVGLNTDYQDIH